MIELEDYSMTSRGLYLLCMYEFCGVSPQMYAHVEVSVYGISTTPFALSVWTAACATGWSVHFQQ